MSQRDVIAEIAAARVVAPAELRERIRLVAAGAPREPRRLLTWRRGLVLALPVAAAIAAAVIVTRPSHHAVAVPPTPVELQAQTGAKAFGSAASGAVTGSSAPGTLNATSVPAIIPSPARIQRYSATLSLRVRNSTAVSSATKRATQIVTSFGGYVVSADVDAQGSFGNADLVLKVPKTKVRQAISGLAALGTIISEQVDLQDLQAGIATADRTIARLQAQLAGLRAEQQTPAVTRQIAAITAQVQALQRAQASTIRAARYATIDLHVATRTAVAPKKHTHGPLHGLGVAFRWIGIGAVYGLALGVPALLLIGLGWVAVRAIRRRREDLLLSRP